MTSSAFASLRMARCPRILPGPCSPPCAPRSADVQPIRRPLSASAPQHSMSASSAIQAALGSFATSRVSSSADHRHPVNFSRGGFTVSKQMPDGKHTYRARRQDWGLRSQEVGSRAVEHRRRPARVRRPSVQGSPFFLGISGTRSYGIFLDNTWRTRFDFGKQARDAIVFRLRVRAAQLLLHLWAHAKKVLENYADLTGKPPLRRCGRWVSAIPLQLLSIICRHGKSPVVCAQTRFPPTFFISTSTIRTESSLYCRYQKGFPHFPGFVSDLRQQHFTS